MRRVLSLYLATWVTDLAKRRRRRANPHAGPPEFVLLVGTSGQKRVVQGCCARSVATGVRAGMTAAHARALLPAAGVHMEEHRPERDLAMLGALAAWAMRFSPVVAVDAPDGLLMDVTGCAHLFGGERAMAGRVVAAVRRLGFEALAAIAPTFGCAWAVARHGGRTIAVVPDGRQGEALAPLPMRALGIDESTEAALAEIGVERIGHLLDLPRSELPARFGGDLLLRLDRALGHAIESIEPVRPTEAPHVERAFDGQTTRLESVEAAAWDALEDLCGELAARRHGVRLLHVELARCDCPPARLVITLGRASGDARHLWSLLRPRLERVNLGFGVERVALTAVRTGRLRHVQPGLESSRASHWSVHGEEHGAVLPCAEARRWIGELVDVLVNRLGASRVTRVQPVASHLPERAFRHVPVSEAGGEQVYESAATFPDRPSVLLEHPERARVIVLTPYGPLLRLSWRGRDRAIVRCVGPERIEPEWWRDGAGVPARDWFRVQDDAGRWIWVFREVGSCRWFVHGLWA